MNLKITYVEINPKVTYSEEEVIGNLQQMMKYDLIVDLEKYIKVIVYDTVRYSYVTISIYLKSIGVDREKKYYIDIVKLGYLGSTLRLRCIETFVQLYKLESLLTDFSTRSSEVATIAYVSTHGHKDGVH